MRVKAVLSYDGSKFAGFQKQTHTPHTVTHALEKALQSLQIESPITGSGRTDAGVHATGQVIHFDLPEYWQDLQKLKTHLNRKLQAIHIKHITAVESDFHARFWATKRTYRYLFKTSKPSVFEQNYIAHYSDFDACLLQEALKLFLGEHDFEYFRKTGSPTHTTIRSIYDASYLQRQKYHYIYISANGFLRAQVRMMIASAMLYAQGKLSLQALQDQLERKNRHTTSLAPPQGLYLARIIYKRSSI